MQWNQVNAIQKSDPFIYDGYAGAFASFFQTGNPDAHKVTNNSVPGVPETQYTRMEFVVSTEELKTVKIVQLEKRCEFWLRNGKDVPI
jgi:hypothetical protein